MCYYDQNVNQTVMYFEVYDNNDKCEGTPYMKGSSDAAQTHGPLPFAKDTCIVAPNLPFIPLNQVPPTTTRQSQTTSTNHQPPTTHQHAAYFECVPCLDFEEEVVSTDSVGVNSVAVADIDGDNNEGEYQRWCLGKKDEVEGRRGGGKEGRMPTRLCRYHAPPHPVPRHTSPPQP